MNTNPDIGASHGTERPAELPALTSLRGLAAITVLLFHSSYVAFNYAGGELPGLWRRGYLAVDLFFFLSGFVLTHAYGTRLANDWSWRAVAKFLWARFCRVYPASLFATAVFVLAFTVGRLSFPVSASFKEQFIAALFLMQIPWLDHIVINSPSWSISAECYAYLLFPLILPLIFRLSGRVAAVIGVALLAGIAIEHTLYTHEQTARGWGALIRTLPEFATGIFAYRAYRKRLFAALWEKDATLLFIMGMVIGACFVGASDGVIAPILLALLLAGVCNSGRMASFIDAWPLRWLGDVSYSVYIFQTMPLMLVAGFSGVLVKHGLGGAWFTVLAASLGLGSGVLVHRCVDLPIRAALRRLPDRVMAFAAAYRGIETRVNPLAALSTPERDR